MEFGTQKVEVHSGFKKEYNISEKSLKAALAQVTDQRKELHIASHSLGGVVAQIAALDLSTNHNNKSSYRYYIRIPKSLFQGGLRALF